MDKVKVKVNRADREVDVREDPVKEAMWQPAALLPEFVQKPGYVYRWIRVSLLNEPDNMNVSSKMREGWEPVAKGEHPELKVGGMALDQGRYKDNIEIGGLLLCKAPKEVMDQRQAYIDKKTKAQTDAVDASYLSSQNDSRMPKFAEGSETFGRGRK
tara:strand:- start:3530 stop:4000 length:471 start_codon:yes stop_codon:yes gene_type:complete